ncbi:unnamed protein product [Cylindrotheca closterium]|uniref:polynucleotide adenylyltransferase n=1 Tax=Cylindrotheca closterium TaxID=2856 RepID=A0AAD2CPK7_9STRA|nr:unnamed protein product [Cylindrotheca closterium]
MKPLYTNLEQEIGKSAELEKLLIANGSMCTCASDDERNRRTALETLEMLATKWVREQHQNDTTMNGGRKEEEEHAVVNPTIITFGSYSLRVHRQESDIDALCLFDKRITREMFFTDFVDFLCQDSRVSGLLAIENAFTPVVKFLLHGIYIDLLFASVSDNSKLDNFHNLGRPKSLSMDTEYKVEDSDLAGMDEASVRSLNGVRVTQFIEQKVKNLPHFRTCLCAIKAWAIEHGCYSNVLGFLGGVNFALLLTHVCLEYPESESWPASVLFKQFFRTFALWEFPQPVMLTQEVNRNPPFNMARMYVWDQSQQRDVMPIITPVYPSMNSSHNVALPQHRRIKDELIRTAFKLEQGFYWDSILQDCDFFRRNSNFIQVTISAKEGDEYYKWCSFCRSKLRLLISSLETRQTSIWPFAKFFEDESCDFEGGGPHQPRRLFFFMALRFTSPLNSGKVNLKRLMLDFLHKVNSFKGRTEGMDLQISHAVQHRLPAFILDKYIDGSNPQQSRDET